MTVPDIQQSALSRVFLIEGRAGPTNTPQYMGLWRAGALSYDQGGVTRIFIPDQSRYGHFRAVSKFRDAPGNPEMTLTARSELAKLSKMLRLANLGCDFDVQIHFGRCKNPALFNGGWDKVLVLESSSSTSYSTDELGALGPDEQAVVNEMLDIAAEDAYEIKRMSYALTANSQVVNEIMALTVCDEETCGECGAPSSGCDFVLAVTSSTGASPGLPAELIYTLDGGTTWYDLGITTMPTGDDPDDIECFGEYAVVVSGDDEAWHYALLSDIVSSGGTSVTWTRDQLGLTSVGAPIQLYVSDASHMWSIGQSSRLYFMENLFDDALIQHVSGDITSSTFNAISGIDNEQFIIGASANVLLLSRTGGQLLTLVVGPEVSASLTAVYMVSDNQWWVGTSTGNLYYTFDAGTTWFQKGFSGQGTGSFQDIKFTTPSVGFFSKGTSISTSRVFRTIDGGNSWYIVPGNPGETFPTIGRINSIAVCADPNVVYMGGANTTTPTDGTLIKGS